MADRNIITLTVYGNRGEHAFVFPAKWIICPECDGHATDRGRSVECDGGGFTASEWAEQDEDFRDDYIAGRYDQPCRPCEGTGKVHTVDRKETRRYRWLVKVLAEYDRQQRDSADIDAMQAAERRMGA